MIMEAVTRYNKRTSRTWQDPRTPYFLRRCLKSFIPVLVVKFLLCPAVPTLNADLIQLVTGFAAVMGHDYPVFLKFKGERESLQLLQL